MSILCIQTRQVIPVTCFMTEQQAHFLYMLPTDDPQVFQLYFQIPLPADKIILQYQEHHNSIP